MNFFDFITGRKAEQVNLRKSGRETKRENGREAEAELEKPYEDVYSIVFKGLRGFANAKRPTNLEWDPVRSKFELSRFSDGGFNPAFAIDNNEKFSLEAYTPQKVVPIYREGEVFIKHYMPRGYYPDSIKEIKSKYEVRVIQPIPLNMAYNPDKSTLHIYVPYTKNSMVLRVKDGLPVEVMGLKDPSHLLAAAFYSVECFEFVKNSHSDYKLYKPGPSYIAQYLDIPDLSDNNQWKRIELEINNL